VINTLIAQKAPKSGLFCTRMTLKTFLNCGGLRNLICIKNGKNDT
jgi:hypothetical protein